MRWLMYAIGPLRQAAFFGPTVANGALRTWLDLQLAPPSRDEPSLPSAAKFAVMQTAASTTECDMVILE